MLLISEITITHINKVCGCQEYYPSSEQKNCKKIKSWLKRSNRVWKKGKNEKKKLTSRKKFKKKLKSESDSIANKTT